MLLFYGEHVTQIELLWGPHGLIPADQVIAIHPSFPFIRLWTTAGGTVALYIASVVIAFLYVLGLYPRFISWLFAATTISFFLRDPLILDGGQNLVSIIAVYLVLVDTSVMFALRVARLKWLPETVRHVGTIIHNFAMLMVLAQISMVYFWSSFYKVTGHKWQDGTALYYIMRVDAFQLPNLSPFFYHSATFVTLATYGTIIAEMSFAILLWNNRWRIPTLCGVVLLHLGIAIFMGLTEFAIIMIVVDLAVLTNSDVEKIRLNIKRLRSRIIREVIVSRRQECGESTDRA